MRDALAVSFDQSVGHDYLEDGDARFEFLSQGRRKDTFDLEFFNKITKGGFYTKTLNIAVELVLVNLCLCVIWFKLFVSR